MAGMIWTNVGIENFNDLGGGFAISAKQFGFFVNDYTPLVTTVLGDLTEPSNSGYARQGSMGWISPSASGGVLTGTLESPTWTFTANAFAESIYGWFLVVNSGSGLILAGAKRFSAPHLIPAVGESLPMTFNFTIQKAS